MSCTYPNREETLVAYAYDELEPAKKRAFALHVATCATCHAEAAGFSEIRQQLVAWSPPDLVRSSIEPAAPVKATRHWNDLPAWMQVAAAVLVLGVSAGVANLHVEVGTRGLSIQTGWMGGATPSGNAAPATQADLVRVRQELQGTVDSIKTQPPALIAPTHLPDEDVLRQTRALVAASERRQQTEFALRLADMRQDLQQQRNFDLTKIDQRLNLIDRSTVALNARTLNTINNRLARTVSETR